MRDSAGMRPAVLSRGDGLQRSASASSLASRNSSEFRDTPHKSLSRLWRPKTRVYDYNRVTITKNTTMMTIAPITRYIAWVIAFPLPGLVNKVMDHTTLRQSIGPGQWPRDRPSEMTGSEGLNNETGAPHGRTPVSPRSYITP